MAWFRKWSSAILLTVMVLWAGGLLVSAYVSRSCAEYGEPRPYVIHHGKMPMTVMRRECLRMAD